MTNSVQNVPGLTADLDPVLAELVDRFTHEVQGGKPITVEAFANAHPKYAEQLRRLLPAVQALAEMEPASQDAAGDAVVDLKRGRLGDYRVVREVGRGGMGIVYEAEQISLHRRVALKVLPFASNLDRRNLQRFKNEARAAAQLHHTNIVPVFFTGTERGLHFYAMQFIEGRTLADVIAEMRRGKRRRSAPSAPTHVRTPRPAVGDAPTGPYVPTPPVAALSTHRTGKPAHFRSVALLGIQAAEALEHAHQSGVIHRDIKPGNLMVDERSNLWVTDFGLAHMHGEPGVTMTGDIVGTLRYMSPEQATAKRGIVDHRTDIYSLGVTLYELLTLTDAFVASDRQKLLHAILENEPRLPRLINKHVPADLETIVLKAMAKNPGERYATAQELADDLRRFLEGQPILATRPSVLQRASKWAWRHRAMVGGVLTSMVLALAGLMLAYALLWIEEQNTRMQKESADKSAKIAREQARIATDLRHKAEKETERADERARVAEDRLRMALEYVKYTSQNLAGMTLAKEPRLRPLQREFMGKAMDFANRLCHTLRVQPNEHCEVAVVQFRIAEIQERVGDVELAQAGYQTAIKTFEKALEQYKVQRSTFIDPNIRLLIAVCHLNLANMCGDAERLAAAEQEVSRALAEYHDQVRRWPNGCPLWPGQLANLAGVYGSYGDLLFALGQVQEAEQYLRKGLDVAAKLIRERPPFFQMIEPYAWAFQSQVRRDLAALLQFTGRQDEAEDQLGKAVEDSKTAVTTLTKLHSSVKEEYPADEGELQSELALSYLRWGSYLQASRRFAEAEPVLGEGLNLCERLVSANLTRPRYRELAALTRTELGMVLLANGKLSEAVSACREAASRMEGFVVESPTIPDNHEGYARTLHHVALCLAAKGDMAGATKYFEGAVRHQQAALELNAKHPWYRKHYEVQMHDLAQHFMRDGNAAKAQSCIDDAMKWIASHQWSEDEVKRFRDTMSALVGGKT